MECLEVKMTSWGKKKKNEVTHFGGPDNQRCSDWKEERLSRKVRLSRTTEVFPRGKESAFGNKKKKKKKLKSVILPVKLELSSATDSPSSPP